MEGKMAENPNYNWKAWNDLDDVGQQLKELHALMHVIWRDAAKNQQEELGDSIGALMRITNSIRDQVEDIGEIVAPEAAKAA